SANRMIRTVVGLIGMRFGSRDQNQAIAVAIAATCTNGMTSRRIQPSRCRLMKEKNDQTSTPACGAMRDGTIMQRNETSRIRSRMLVLHEMTFSARRHAPAYSDHRLLHYSRPMSTPTPHTAM